MAAEQYLWPVVCFRTRVQLLTMYSTPAQQASLPYCTERIKERIPELRLNNFEPFSTIPQLCEWVQVQGAASLDDNVKNRLVRDTAPILVDLHSMFEKVGYFEKEKYQTYTAKFITALAKVYLHATVGYMHNLTVKESL